MGLNCSTCSAQPLYDDRNSDNGSNAAVLGRTRMPLLASAGLHPSVQSTPQPGGRGLPESINENQTDCRARAIRHAVLSPDTACQAVQSLPDHQLPTVVLVVRQHPSSNVWPDETPAATTEHRASLQSIADSHRGCGAQQPQKKSRLIPVWCNTALLQVYGLSSSQEYSRILKRLASRDPLLVHVLEKVVRNLQPGTASPCVQHITADPCGGEPSLSGLRLIACWWAADSESREPSRALSPAIIVQHGAPFDVKEIVPRILRDNHNLNLLPNIVTVTTFQGKALYQNAASLNYFGDLGPEESAAMGLGLGAATPVLGGAVDRHSSVLSIPDGQYSMTQLRASRTSTDLLGMAMSQLAATLSSPGAAGATTLMTSPQAAVGHQDSGTTSGAVPPHQNVLKQLFTLEPDTLQDVFNTLTTSNQWSGVIQVPPNIRHMLRSERRQRKASTTAVQGQGAPTASRFLGGHRASYSQTSDAFIEVLDISSRHGSETRPRMMPEQPPALPSAPTTAQPAGRLGLNAVHAGVSHASEGQQQQFLVGQITHNQSAAAGARHDEPGQDYTMLRSPTVIGSMQASYTAAFAEQQPCSVSDLLRKASAGSTGLIALSSDSYEFDLASGPASAVLKGTGPATLEPVQEAAELEVELDLLDDEDMVMQPPSQEVHHASQTQQACPDLMVEGSSHMMDGSGGHVTQLERAVSDLQLRGGPSSLDRHQPIMRGMSVSQPSSMSDAGRVHQQQSQQQRTNSTASEFRQSAQLTKEALSFSERSGSLSKSVTAVLDAIDRKRSQHFELPGVGGGSFISYQRGIFSRLSGVQTGSTHIYDSEVGRSGAEGSLDLRAGYGSFMRSSTPMYTSVLTGQSTNHGGPRSINDFHDIYSNATNVVSIREDAILQPGKPPNIPSTPAIIPSTPAAGQLSTPAGTPVLVQDVDQVSIPIQPLAHPIRLPPGTPALTQYRQMLPGMIDTNPSLVMLAQNDHQHMSMINNIAPSRRPMRRAISSSMVMDARALSSQLLLHRSGPGSGPTGQSAASNRLAVPDQGSSAQEVGREPHMLPDLQRQHPQAPSQSQPPCYHEVTVFCMTDPVLDQKVLLVTQTDVTKRIDLECKLAELTSAQMCMLEQMFPRHVIEHMLCDAGQMSNDVGRLANHHDMVSVLFADVVGFTSMSNEISAAGVMMFLNALYSEFDSMLEEYGLYQLDTMGDCYIVAGGLVQKDEHGAQTLIHSRTPQEAAQDAHNIMQFAKAMMLRASQVPMPHNGQPVQLRVGIHSGRLVSGMLGTRLPKFTLFGDTMNLSSRMESLSVPGCIHVSEAFYHLLHQHTAAGGASGASSTSGYQHTALDAAGTWTETGGIEVKGKGVMNTYLYRPATFAPELLTPQTTAAQTGNGTAAQASLLPPQLSSNSSRQCPLSADRHQAPPSAFNSAAMTLAQTLSSRSGHDDGSEPDPVKSFVAGLGIGGAGLPVRRPAGWRGSSQVASSGDMSTVQTTPTSSTTNTQTVLHAHHQGTSHREARWLLHETDTASERDPRTMPTMPSAANMSDMSASIANTSRLTSLQQMPHRTSSSSINKLSLHNTSEQWQPAASSDQQQPAAAGFTSVASDRVAPAPQSMFVSSATNAVETDLDSCCFHSAMSNAIADVSDLIHANLDDGSSVTGSLPAEGGSNHLASRSSAPPDVNDSQQQQPCITSAAGAHQGVSSLRGLGRWLSHEEHYGSHLVVSHRQASVPEFDCSVKVLDLAHQPRGSCRDVAGLQQQQQPAQPSNASNQRCSFDDFLKGRQPVRTAKSGLNALCGALANRAIRSPSAERQARASGAPMPRSGPLLPSSSQRAPSLSRPASLQPHQRVASLRSREPGTLSQPSSAGIKHVDTTLHPLQSPDKAVSPTDSTSGQPRSHSQPVKKITLQTTSAGISSAGLRCVAANEADAVMTCEHTPASPHTSAALSRTSRGNDANQQHIASCGLRPIKAAIAGAQHLVSLQHQPYTAVAAGSCSHAQQGNVRPATVSCVTGAYHHHHHHHHHHAHQQQQQQPQQQRPHHRRGNSGMSMLNHLGAALHRATSADLGSPGHSLPSSSPHATASGTPHAAAAGTTL